MKYTEAELKQIDKNLQMVVNYLIENYVDNFDNSTDRLWAFLDAERDYGLCVRGDGEIIFYIGNTNIIINKIDGNDDRLRLFNGAEFLAHWKELKYILKDNWDTRNKKRNMVTFGFEL